MRSIHKAVKVMVRPPQKNELETIVLKTQGDSWAEVRIATVTELLWYFRQ